MDPLLAKLLPDPRRRRVAVAIGVALAAVALVVAVAVSAVGADGSVARITPAAVPRPSPSAVLVQVTGAVRRPGLVSLPDGARAVDAIAAAGGATAQADESQVNLAARVMDGQHLVVPQHGAAPTALATGGPISLSTATEAQLETLPRIGPAMAARILAWRAANGGFRSVNDLLKVGGIGPKTLAGLKDAVTP